ncbi:hypothetical protein ACFPIJ_17475 [Dactylosporangium cerinum]|uniref:Uncharacterized protein n=1 Tax=Dactylosporangium cerinum TaxID=1434730 RepID=A0ABV9VW51_9ACTN
MTPATLPAAAPPSLPALAAALAAPTELAQAVGVLAAAGVPTAGLTLGGGDRVLLGLHRALTGRDVAIAAACPSCGVLGEVVLTADTLPPPSGVGDGPVRPPTYADLAGLPVGSAGAAELLRRCTVAGRGPATADDLAGVDDSLCGPLVFGCPACAEPVRCAVDAQTLALRGLLDLLRRYDREIHLLAAAYHWDLATIEALPDSRRSRLAAYVEAER